jgi:hypothetical protein
MVGPKPRRLPEEVVPLGPVGGGPGGLAVEPGRELQLPGPLPQVRLDRGPPGEGRIERLERGQARPGPVRLNRAVAVGEADGAPAGLAALAEVDDDVPRRDAVAAHLHEKNGDLELAARLYADAARNAPNLAERDHQTRQAARLNDRLRSVT